MAHSTLFISYSHRDKDWLERLQIHLAPLERDNKIERWDDSKIVPGADWKEEIRKALESAQVAVLLVSAPFLASEFITKNELPPLLDAAKDHGVLILPVILSPCRFHRTPSLYRFQAVNPNLTPLTAMDHHSQEELLVKLVDAIEDALEGLTAKAAASASAIITPSPPVTTPVRPSLPALQVIHGWPAARVQELQRQTAEALGIPLEFRDRLKDHSQGPEMVVIPAGEFLMGSPTDELDRIDDERQHRVVIERPFAAGKYALTVGEFEKFVRASGYKTETEQENGSDSWRNPGFAQTSDHPVIRVSWNDAMVYIEWLSDQTDAVYRLMTEAQWEYAARAGTTTPFHFGSTISTDQANYNGNYIYGDGKKGVYRKQTAPVGQFPANHWGLHDTHGNVWEWTASEYEEDYSGKEGLIVSKNNAESVRVVVRGGSWDDWPARVRSARRGDLAPRGRVDNQGFRLARPL